MRIAAETRGTGSLSKAGRFCRLALRPLRHIADFRGRSSRSELFAYWLLWLLIYIGLAALQVYRDWPPTPLTAILTASLVPVFPLLVRRMHDQNLSGAWLLFFVPLPTLRAWQSYSTGAEFKLHKYEPLDQWPSDAFGFALAAAAICWFGIMYVATAGAPDRDNNRYGPNPRRFRPGDPDF